MEPLKPLVHVKGPSDSGPGERSRMLDEARKVLVNAGIDTQAIVRIDVPGRGQSSSAEAVVRPEVEPMIPAMQSGSLFGDRIGVLVVDAHHLRLPEARVVTEVLGQTDSHESQVVLVSSGALSPSLAAHVRKHGDTISIRKLREREAAEWLRTEVRSRRMKVRADAQAALLEKFGSDVGALARALDQLAVVKGSITGDLVQARFRNRPDEPIWHLTDALSRGAVDEALRRLHDLLTHIHPLVVVAALERDLQWLAMAEVAPDVATFAGWVGSKPDWYPVQKSWRAGKRMTDDNLAKAADALRRADAALKTMPQETHLVTLERLTVSLCYRYRR